MASAAVPPLRMGDWSRTLSRSTAPAAPSVTVELHRVAVRVLDVDGRAPPASANPDLRVLQPLAHPLPLRLRQVQAEVIEATRRRIESLPRLDEVQQVVATGRLQEQHAGMREGDAETEHVHVEPLGGAQVPALEREVT